MACPETKVAQMPPEIVDHLDEYPVHDRIEISKDEDYLYIRADDTECCVPNGYATVYIDTQGRAAVTVQAMLHAREVLVSGTPDDNGS